MDIMGLGLRNINLYASKMTTVKTGFSNFQDVLDANMGEWDLEDMLKTQYPGLKYHVADTSKINSLLWQRNDYPFEMFFEDNLDNAVLDWKPMSENPSMLDTGVQARLNAARGKYAVIIPPELEEKLKENPELSQNIMNKISALIKKQDTVPSSIDSFNITLDADGNISNYRFSGGGGEATMSFKTERLDDEDKYCSLCGSRIKGDGSCPICIVPTFISGNRKTINIPQVYFNQADITELSHISAMQSAMTNYKK